MTIHQIKSLPLFDVEESFDSMNEFFFSMYYDDKSYHTKLHLDNGKIKLQNGDDDAPLDFAMTGKVKKNILLKDLHVVFDGKVTDISAVQGKNIGHKVSSLAVSHDGSWIAIGGDHGKLAIYDSSIANPVDCIGHKSDITLLKFFPSGQVLLSGSLDMSLKVWGMDGSNPVTLLGHTRAITDVEMIERGRLIVSSSMDGTAKLWHIASSVVLYTFSLSAENNGVTTLRVLDCSWLDCSSKPNKEDPEFDLTKNKLLLLGTANGSVHGYNLFDRNLLFTISLPENIRIKSLDSSLGIHKIWLGLDNGILCILSIDETFKVCIESMYRRSKSPLYVSSKPCKNSEHLWLSSSDGSCALWSFKDDQILRELAFSTTQSSCVYGFSDDMILCSGSSGLVYMLKLNH